MPVVGQIQVAGKTIPEIESAISNAYYPVYARTYPSVLVRLSEAQRQKITILGAVVRPGVYELRADQMSLVWLLTEAGGILQQGAACIKIIRQGQQPTVLTLPIKGLNVPFSDVGLEDGDQVIVERLVMPVFTVIGLVNRPGNFEYPPDANYNLIQAIAFAGGLDLRLDPRYAVIYRRDVDGSVVSAVFQLSDPSRPQVTTTGIDVPIKPGDIVAIEHTPRTRSREFLDRIFNVHIGAYLPLIR
jgi:polysaccharide export outer membrane protein